MLLIEINAICSQPLQTSLTCLFDPFRCAVEGRLAARKLEAKFCSEEDLITPSRLLEPPSNKEFVGEGTIPRSEQFSRCLLTCLHEI